MKKTVLLILASQRIETVLNSWFGRTPGNFGWISDDVTTKRGAPPTMIEWLILAWVFGTKSAFYLPLLLLSIYSKCVGPEEPLHQEQNNRLFLKSRSYPIGSIPLYIYGALLDDMHSNDKNHYQKKKKEKKSTKRNQS